MNVDEATQAAKEYNENFVRQHFPLPSVTYSQRVAITLLAEVERLHAELAACQNLLDETRTELSICGAFHSIAKKEWQLEVERVNRLEAQLAAAKAASVWPVGWTEIRTNPGGNVVIYTENHEIAFQLMAWLRDRIKDIPPPKT